MNTRYSRRFWLGLAASALLHPFGLSAAEPLKAPAGKVILTIGGQVAAPNRGKEAVFDMAMLEALPQTSFTTLTPWENQPIRFTGPLLRDVLAAAQAKGSNLKATALNDYRINIPMADTTQFDMVLALRMNGEPMSVRTRGPLFIVYPFDSKPELKSATYYERSIWQLKSLTVE